MWTSRQVGIADRVVWTLKRPNNGSLQPTLTVTSPWGTWISTKWVCKMSSVNSSKNCQLKNTLVHWLLNKNAKREKQIPSGCFWLGSCLWVEASSGSTNFDKPWARSIVLVQVAQECLAKLDSTAAIAFKFRIAQQMVKKLGEVVGEDALPDDLKTFLRD